MTYTYTIFERAAAALRAAGYDISASSTEERIILAVTDPGDDGFRGVRAAMGGLMKGKKEREFQIEKIPTGPRLRAELIKRGFDGETYLGTGKRGATVLFYRVAATGEFVGVLS